MFPDIKFDEIIDQYTNNCKVIIDDNKLNEFGFIIANDEECENVVLSILWQLEDVYKSSFVNDSIKSNILSLHNRLIPHPINI